MENAKINKEDYLKEQKKRVLKLFKWKYKPGFKTKHDLADWFVEKLEEQDFKCEYCQTSVFDLISLIEKGKLKARKIGFGYRGKNLEIDKQDNDKGYSRDNCVLACCYCNNDKSSIFDAKDYKKYLAKGHKEYFEYLLNL